MSSQSSSEKVVLVGQGGGWKEVLTVAYPLILSSMSMTIMHFIDRVFLSWYSTDAIAAALPGGITAFTIIAFFSGVSRYTNTFVAQYYGAREYRRCGQEIWQGIYFSLLAAALIPCLSFIGEGILRWGSHSEEIFLLERSYFRLLIMFGGIEVFNGAVSSFFTGRSKTLIILAVNLSANITNALLDYCLIFGNFGFPEMGIQGAAIATIIGGSVAPIILFVLMLTRRNRERYATGDWRYRPLLFKKLLRFGVPAGIHFLLEISSFTAFVILVGRLGDIELAASNIAFSINTLSFFPMIGLSIATSTVVGQYVGKRDMVSANRTPYSSLKIALIYVAIFALPFWFSPETFFGIFMRNSDDFSRSSEVLRYGIQLLRMVAVFGFFDAMNLCFGGGLKGAGDTRFPMWVSILGGWLVFIPGAYLMITFFDMSLIAVWMWMTLYISFLGFILWLRFRNGYWKTLELIEHEVQV